MLCPPPTPGYPHLHPPCSRRILRHLYLSPLRACWLLEGVKQKFLDAMLASARVELFMPKVRRGWVGG